jgi:hypothetical protein
MLESQADTSSGRCKTTGPGLATMAHRGQRDVGWGIVVANTHTSELTLLSPNRIGNRAQRDFHSQDAESATGAQTIS